MKSLSDRADELEYRMAMELEKHVPIRSPIYRSGERAPRADDHEMDAAIKAGKTVLMGPDARLPPMPQKPTLIDFFRLRFGNTQHLLQSARLAKINGHEEKVIVACLLHDISVTGFISADHGYWAAQMIEPYVDEEISWAVRAHQVLRFFPDPDVGYGYPEAYIKYFGEDFAPEQYVCDAYEVYKANKYYMTGRLITMNDVYAFDPNVRAELDDFVDILGRHFRQPEEGLGKDNSPASHMWRTIMWPTRAL